MAAAVSVWAQINVPGLHRWPEAPLHRAYLRNYHRHMFRITAEVTVDHDERDIEFHDLQDIMHDWWDGGPLKQCGTQSCETMARRLVEHLEVEHGLAVVSVEVSEDGEAGAIVRPQRTKEEE